MQDGHTNEIEIADNVKVYMRYPYLNDMAGLGNSEDAGIDAVFKLLKKCIDEIHYSEDVYNRIDITSEELDEFVDNLSTEAFEKIGNFFETMPKLVHILNVTNPKTKKTGEVVIQGLENFFV